MSGLLNINPSAETNKIISFIKTVLREQKFENVVIGLSGGIDSAVCFSLLQKSIPPQNIFVAHLSYFKSKLKDFKNSLEKANVPSKNIYELPIRNVADGLKRRLNILNEDKVRLGNVMARIRMIMLYDLAKKHNGLVCGTENKSEFCLGYFTRFGDEASDFEPIQHLYKTQVVQLADYLAVPKNIICQTPTAGLWLGQTDETDFGFSYKEADNVLYLYFEQKNNLSEIISKGFPNAKKIIDYVRKNSFKHRLPYAIE